MMIQTVERFTEYLRENRTWGSLHIVMDDDNFDDSCVAFCIELAEQEGDFEGVILGRILLTLTEVEREALAWRCAIETHGPYWPYATSRPEAEAKAALLRVE